MVAFYSTEKKFCYLFSVGGHNCEKENKILYIANEEKRTTAADSQ